MAFLPLFYLSSAGAANIVALVNDRLITRNDTETAFRQFLLESGLRESPEIRKNFYNEAVKNLVERELQRSELQRNALEISDEETEKNFLQIAQRLNLSKAEFNALLLKNDIPRDFFLDSVRVDIGWNRLIRNLYANNLRISDKDIRAEAQRFLKQRQEASFNLDLILLPHLSGQKKTQLKRARSLIRDLQKGANFSKLAQFFSIAPGSSNGGSLGWVPASELTKETVDILIKLSANSITPKPLELSEGVAIFRVNGFRAAREESFEKVVLAQIFFPDIEQAQQASKNSMDCEQRITFSKELGAVQSQTLPPLRYSELSPELRGDVAKLSPGQAAGPFYANQQAFILSLCSIEPGKLSDQDYQTIRNALFIRQFENYARLYLRKLWFSAIIDIRTPDVELNILNS